MSAGGSRRRLVPPLRQLLGGGWGSWRPASCPANCGRLVSAQAAPSELPSLKAALRAIYKRVHPDLFHDCQTAKDANTRSFKLLHEYLDEAKVGPKVPVPYRFHFYIRAGASGGSSSGGSSGGQPPAATLPGLREVRLTLPPPTRGGPGELMSGTTRKAFGELLGELGLPTTWGAGSEEEQAAEASAYGRLVSLREFLPAAVETVHQHAAAQVSAQQQLGALRTALRLGRRVQAGFAEPAASAGVLQQLPLLQQLVAALDALPPGAPDLGGLRLTVGAQSYGVDALGTVWLAADGSTADWSRHLAAVDPAQCRERQRLRQQVQQQEAAVAAALGVAMVYTQQELSLSPQYRHALERLAAAAAARGPVAGGSCRELPVLLQAPGDGGQAPGGGGSAAGGCTTDTQSGLLAAPLDVSADQLYAAAEQLGGQVMSAVRRRHQREAELAALRTQVERKIMLRRLLRDPAVDDRRFKSCLERMLAHAQKLSGLLHGQAVRVAEINALSPDRSVINIAWNWRLE